MAGNTALFRVTPTIADKAHQIQQGALRNYNSLGVAGGTGRIDHIGARLRRGRAELARHFRLFRFLHQTIVQQQLGLGVIQHIADTFVGAVRIHGDIGRPGLPDANRGHHEVLGTADFDRHKIVGLDRMIDQILCHGVRQSVQFAIGVCAPLIHHRFSVRTLGSLRLEEIQPGFSRIVISNFTCRNFKQFLRLVNANQRNFPKRRLGLVHHIPEGGFYGPGEETHCLCAVDGVGGQHADYVVLAHQTDVYADVRLAG